ncbi:MAG: hypothetical protein ABW061_15930 [Polyangiaceae bacterium]
MSQLLQRSLFAGAALAALALFLALERAEPRLLMHTAPSQAVATEPPATTPRSIPASSPLAAPASKSPSPAAPPSAIFDTPLCPDVRLVEVATQDRGTSAWLGDVQGIEQLEIGQRFRDYTLLDAQAQSERTPAVALLRGPAGNCRTASKQEHLAALVNRLRQAAPPASAAVTAPPPPANGLTPALATQLVAALHLRAAAPSASPHAQRMGGPTNQ